MENVKKTIDELKAKGHKFPPPWLQLGIKQDGGGVKSTGKHIVKIIAEPVQETGKNFRTGQDQEEMVFRVKEDGVEKKWSFALFNQEGKPHYLLQQFEDIEVGDTISLELINRGAKNYIEMSKVENSKKPESGEQRKYPDVPVIEEEEEIPGWLQDAKPE